MTSQTSARKYFVTLSHLQITIWAQQKNACLAVAQSTMLVGSYTIYITISGILSPGLLPTVKGVLLAVASCFDLSSCISLLLHAAFILFCQEPQCVKRNVQVHLVHESSKFMCTLTEHKLLRQHFLQRISIPKTEVFRQRTQMVELRHLFMF